ncbi:hypothetical protein BVRB_4g097370 [Beta vulgaris subsp. vulgaris]|uniref:Uncharacterized protein n=1 Tax=Beta vulgaris subsp. vulgaris TaxID=3555 RepID=A0A0J8BCW9_BETVV|nr:hypothetical protein BVRB_4g097370 [Beta vulgaris subsp. vulgaris]
MKKLKLLISLKDKFTIGGNDSYVAINAVKVKTY